MRRSVAINRQGRDFVYRIARELGLEALPSHANFVFHRINGEIQPYIDRMAEAGVRVGRPFPPMLNYNRISIGLPEEMEVWAEALRELRKKGWV
jgi:histidinol-phosphate aminotransferase